MDKSVIRQYIADTFAGVDITTPEEGVAAGDSFFIYDPDHALEPQQQHPFTTIVTKDYGTFDCASHLDRPGVFRLNIGVSPDTFRSLFGSPPAAPIAAETTDPAWDFTALDRLMPHPVYAPQSWVCVLNPGEATFEIVKPLLAEAYQLVAARYARRKPSPRS